MNLPPIPGLASLGDDGVTELSHELLLVHTALLALTTEDVIARNLCVAIAALLHERETLYADLEAARGGGK